MALTKLQVMALSDASAHSGQGQTGLHKMGSKWAADTPNSECHSNRTITALIDRGLMKTWCHGQVAHITDMGARSLADYREQQREKSHV